MAGYDELIDLPASLLGVELLIVLIVFISSKISSTIVLD